MVKEVKAYVSDIATYEQTSKDQAREFGGVTAKQPVIPEYLRLYFELKRWPGSLLVAGGLLDQPAWTWELIDLAGLIFQAGPGSAEKPNLSSFMRG